MYFFDLENNYITGGIVFISALAKDNVRGEKLSLDDFIADQDGYLQVFVAYESEKPVWFDDLKITHQPALVVQENHYYPFGLNITSLEKSGQPECSWQFGGVEKQEEFGLNWLHYKYRFYDVQVSRFFSVDPIAEDYVYLTPYQHASNNPASKIEIEGLEGWSVTSMWESTKRNAYDAAVAIGDFGSGLANAVSSNNTSVQTPDGQVHSLVERRNPESGAESLGQSVGDAISIVQGVAEMTFGGTSTVVTTSTGVGVVATPVTVATTVHGANTTMNGLNNLFGSGTTKATDDNGKVNAAGDYAPNRELPRDNNGIAIPDPDATGPHTQLGTKTSKKRGKSYTQAREFDGKGNAVKDIDFTDHDRPNLHPNPHQHWWEKIVQEGFGGEVKQNL